MSTIIKRLGFDHGRLKNVLTALEKVAEELTPDSVDAHADYLFALVDYLSEYPDKIHHPTEEIFFKQLAAKELSADQLSMLRRTQDQHDVLHQATTDLMALVDSDTGDIDVVEFKAAADSYTRMQREHMALEEQEIFPLVASHLTDSEWQQLEHELETPVDPLFDKTSARYATLYRAMSVDPDNNMDALAAGSVLGYLNATKS